MKRTSQKVDGKARGIPRGQATRLLAERGTPSSRLRIVDAIRDAIASVSCSPLRTVLMSLGTGLAVGTAVATIGLGDSAGSAVSSAFDRLRATSVTFIDNAPRKTPAALSEASERAVTRLTGVVSAGLMWGLGEGQLFTVSRIPSSAASDQAAEASLPITAASPNALSTAGAILLSGRLYDHGMDVRHESVALLGQDAARQLAITRVDFSPTLYVDGKPFTVIGIIRQTRLNTGSLVGVIIPPGAVRDVPGQATSARQLFVRTGAGAAQLVGREGPYAVDPYQPSRIGADVPIDPTQLRNRVNGQVTALLLAVAIVTLVVGMISIANITLLSVVQRKSEIGLRRSVGAAPRHITALVISEAALTGVIGGLIGASAGVLVTSIVSASKGWTPVLNPLLVLVAPVTGGGAGILAGLYPAWRASKITPIAALRQ